MELLLLGDSPCVCSELSERAHCEADVRAVHRKPGSGQLSEDTGKGVARGRGRHADGHCWSGKQPGTE